MVEAARVLRATGAQALQATEGAMKA